MPGRVGEHLPGHRNPTLTVGTRAKNPALKIVGGPLFNRLGNGLPHPLSIIGMDQLLKRREGAGEAHGRQSENSLEFRGEYQRLVVEVLVKGAHAAGSQRQAMPGLTLLENLHDVFLLAVGMVQASCQKPEERQHDQHHGSHSQCHAEIEVVLSRPLGCNANPSGEYRQRNGEGQEASQHHTAELLAGEGGHQAPRRSRAENSQAQCHQQEGAIDGGGCEGPHFVEALNPVQIPDQPDAADRSSHQCGRLIEEVRRERFRIKPQQGQSQRQNGDGCGRSRAPRVGIAGDFRECNAPEVDSQVESKEVFREDQGGKQAGDDRGALGDIPPCGRDGALFSLQPEGEAAEEDRQHGRRFQGSKRRVQMKEQRMVVGPTEQREGWERDRQSGGRQDHTLQCEKHRGHARTTYLRLMPSHREMNSLSQALHRRTYPVQAQESVRSEQQGKRRYTQAETAYRAPRRMRTGGYPSSCPSGAKS